MRSDNLKRHVKTRHLNNSCAAPPSLEENKLAGKKRSIPEEISTLDGIKFGSGKSETADNNQSRNPEIQNEIPSKSRTKADIIGYSDARYTDEDDNNIESKAKVNDDDCEDSIISSSDDKEPAEVDTDNEEEDDEVKKIINNSTVEYLVY